MICAVQFEDRRGCSIKLATIVFIAILDGAAKA